MALLLVLPVFTFASGDEQTAEEWLLKLDHNLSYFTARYTASMLVHHPSGKEREYVFSGEVQGENFALMEFIEPQRDRGTKYLKRKKDLWIYFPRQDRTLHIQGHMLREGVQGSDLSYEDLTESSDLRSKYSPEIADRNDNTVTILLTAHDMTVSYPFREITIERKSALPLKIVDFGVGKVPIKEVITLESMNFGSRKFPVKMEIRSRLVEGKWTRLTFQEIEFGMEFPSDTFTKENLEKR